MNTERNCVWCGNNVDNPKNSTTKRQAIFVRMYIKFLGELIFVHGLACGKCRNGDLAEYQVSVMTLAKLA